MTNPCHQCTYCFFSHEDGHVVVEHEAEEHQAGLKPSKSVQLDSQVDDTYDLFTEKMEEATNAIFDSHPVSQSLKMADSLENTGNPGESDSLHKVLIKLCANIKKYGKYKTVTNTAFAEAKAAIEEYVRGARINELGRAKPYLMNQVGGKSLYFEERIAHLRSTTPGEGESK